MPSTDAFTDVVELCALLQCLGFSVKSMDTSDTNLSQEGPPARTIVVNCQTSGLHVVLENVEMSCSCPSGAEQQASGFWQVSGVARGKQLDKEYGSALLGSLPLEHRERLTRELQNMIRCIKGYNEIDGALGKSNVVNRSASMIELKTPERRTIKPKVDTPTRYRSLDTLTAPGLQKESSEQLPAPGVLQKHTANKEVDATVDPRVVQSMYQRQSTYTLSSTPSNSIRKIKNKTSSPIYAPSSNILENLIAAEKAAEDLRNNLSSVIKEIKEDDKHDSSMSSLMLDVSKISVLKGGEYSKPQFASSPNLLGSVPINQEDLSKKLGKGDSASTSNLALGPSKTDAKEGKMSRLRKLSPSIFKYKRDAPGVQKVEKLKNEDRKNINRSSSFPKPKASTTSRTASKPITEASPNLSATRKKFSHVKSTIPRPTSKKD